MWKQALKDCKPPTFRRYNVGAFGILAPAGSLGFFCFVSCITYIIQEQLMNGTVKFFNTAKGYGFITDEAGKDIFFHRSNVKETGFRDTLKQGDVVSFEVQNGQKGKRAVNIARAQA